MCLIPKAAAGSAVDTRRMLIARRQPLQELKPGSISHLLFLLCRLLISSIMWQPENSYFSHPKGNINAVFCWRVQRIQLEIATVCGVLI